MKRWMGGFNINLWLSGLLLAAMLSGCQSSGDKKPKDKDDELATLRLHLEANLDGTRRTAAVPVYRQNPQYIGITVAPFLTELEVDQAWVLEDAGGFCIQVKFFDVRGERSLELITTAYKGQRIAIHSQFGDQERWLAAPVITRPITNGILVFTPDATREEAEQIVRGLMNYVRKAKKKGIR